MFSKSRLLSLSIAATLVVFFILPAAIYAELLCRSDPEVQLSNGVTVNVGFYTNVPLADVTYVNYEMHVPVGLSLKKAVKTDGWPNGLETFTLIADQSQNTGYVTITVHTTQGNATVIAFGVSKQLGGSELQVPGVEGQALTVSYSYDGSSAGAVQNSPPAPQQHAAPPAPHAPPPGGKHP